VKLLKRAGSTSGSVLALFALVAGCQFPYPGDVPVDAPPADATDAAIDAPPIDAAPTSIGAFAAAGTLVAGRMDAASVLVGDRLYVLGGTACPTCTAVTRDAAGITPSVEVATVSAAGPGMFALAASLGRARAGAVAFRVTRGSADWLYVAGGYNDVTATFPLEIERAAIAADGSIGAFADVAGVALGEGRAHALVIVTGDTVQLVGGWQGGATNTTSVTRATITGNGDLTAFASAGGVNLSSARARMTCVDGGTVALVVGGHDGANVPTTVVERVTVSASAITGFASAPALTTPRSGATSLALGGRAFVLGGGNVATGAALDTIESAQLSPAGPFLLNSRRLDQPRVLASGAVLPGHVCVIGGSSNAAATGILDSVACAPLQ
jgi:hypothetical protein